MQTRHSADCTSSPHAQPHVPPAHSCLDAPDAPSRSPDCPQPAPTPYPLPLLKTPAESYSLQTPPPDQSAASSSGCLPAAKACAPAAPHRCEHPPTSPLLPLPQTTLTAPSFVRARLPAAPSAIPS